MPNQPRHPKDANQTAFSVVRRATEGRTAEKATPEKNPAAVSLGRLGGLKGGKARARILTKKRRAEIARKAAKTRWKDHKKSERNPK